MCVVSWLELFTKLFITPGHTFPLVVNLEARYYGWCDNYRMKKHWLAHVRLFTREMQIFVKPLKFQNLSVAIARVAYSNTFDISLTTIAEKAMAPHSSTLAWRIPWKRGLVGCSPWDCWESDTTERLHFSLSCIGEGNGSPLRCSCLENPGDGGACWSAIYRVAQSWTRLKQLSSSSNHCTLTTRNR